MKFLGVTIYNTLSWESHIDMTGLKLNLACFEIRMVTPFLSLETLKMIHYAYFQTTMNYGTFCLEGGYLLW